MFKRIVVGEADRVVGVIHVTVVWAFELLVLELLLCESMDWKEFCVHASDRAFCLVFVRLLIYPLLNAFPTERRLTFLALKRVENYFQADLANEK